MTQPAKNITFSYIASGRITRLLNRVSTAHAEVPLHRAAQSHAAAIAEQRRTSGLTQVDVAKAMGGNWSQPIIVKIEKGGRRVDLVELLKLADIIGLNVEALIIAIRDIPDE